MIHLMLILSISLLAVAGCRSTTPMKDKLKDEPSDTSTQEPEPTKIFTIEKACEALRADSFPVSAVLDQVQWLCDRDGFAILKNKIANSQGQVAPFEYVTEHDKTLYYAAARSLAAPLTKLDGLNRLFCEDFEALKQRFNGHGLEDVKSINISRKEEGRCEYLQEATPQWGVHADFKASATYGKLEDINLSWRVDAMIAPLNYSPIKKYNVLSLSWEEQGQVQVAYLIRTQVQVSGFLMGTARSKMKSTVSNVLKGFESFIQ